MPDHAIGPFVIENGRRSIADFLEPLGALPGVQTDELGPFEIVLETPHHAPLDRQVEALVVAIRTILLEYRKVISFAQDI